MPDQAKTGVEGPEQQRMVRDMVREYVKGLCWVMAYYYDGARAHWADGLILHGLPVHLRVPQVAAMDVTYLSIVAGWLRILAC